ncbi:MAG: WD40 repeat domain-containing protein [Phycisphaerae bacterium]
MKRAYRIAAIALLGVLPGASSVLAGAKDANVPALVDARKLQTVEMERGNGELLPLMAGVVLSPDGRHLLHTVPAKTPEQETDTIPMPLSLLQRVDYVLRDLKTGKDRKLPVRSSPRMFTLFVSISQPFSADGRRIALCETVSFDPKRFPKGNEMTVRVYDIESGKMHDTGLHNSVTLGTLSPDGKTVAVTSSKSGGDLTSLPDLMVGKVDSTRLKKHSLGGIPLSFCPKGKMLAIVQPPIQPQVPPDAPRTASRMLLHDFTSGKTTELPIGKEAMQTGPSEVAWTRDGRFFAYGDWEKFVRNPGPDQQEDHRHVTRLWDIKNGKPAADLPDLVPVAPGPTESSIFCRAARGKQRDRGRGIYLYDHATKKKTQLGKDEHILISAGGDRLVYGVKNDNSLDIYLAGIKMPGRR